MASNQRRTSFTVTPADGSAEFTLSLGWLKVLSPATQTLVQYTSAGEVNITSEVLCARGYTISVGDLLEDAFDMRVYVVQQTAVQAPHQKLWLQELIAADTSFDATTLNGIRLWINNTSHSGADGTAIASVTDLSGNGNTAVQSTAGNRPLRKLAIQNSLAVLRFDGADDYLDLSSEIPLTVGSSTALTFCFVGKFTHATGQTVLGGPDLGCPEFYMTNAGSGGVYFEKSNVTTIISDFAAAWYNTWAIFTVTYDGVNYDLRRNGVTIRGGSNSLSFAAALTRIMHGRHNQAGGDLGELVICDRVLAPASLLYMETGLNAKWAIY